MLRRMDQELEALAKAHGHVHEIARLAELAGEHLAEGKFEDAAVCLRLIEKSAEIGKDVLGLLAGD
jgi:hypothetical protein